MCEPTGINRQARALYPSQTHPDHALLVQHPAHLEVLPVEPEAKEVTTGRQKLRDEPNAVGDLEGDAVLLRGREEGLPLVGGPVRRGSGLVQNIAAA